MLPSLQTTLSYKEHLLSLVFVPICSLVNWSYRPFYHKRRVLTRALVPVVANSLHHLRLMLPTMKRITTSSSHNISATTMMRQWSHCLTSRLVLPSIVWRCGWRTRLEQRVTHVTLLHWPTSVKTRRLAVLICGELVMDPYQQTMPIQNTPLLHRPTLLLVTSTKWRVFLMVQVLWVVTTTKSWQMPDCSIVLNTRSTMPWVISHWKAVYKPTKYWRLPTNIPMVA